MSEIRPSEPLTKAEKSWCRKVEKLLKNPPTDRLGLYTTGDACLEVYDKSKDHLLDYEKDYCIMVDEQQARLDYISSATQIHSTAG